MGRPGKLKLRTAVKGSGGQISLNNFTAEIIAKDLANKLKIASASINYMSNNEKYLVYIKKRIDIDVNGYLDVIAHGNENNIFININGKILLINHRILSKIIKNKCKSKKINGVRLLSCNTGASDDGFAQKLADKLHLPVSAPNKYSFVRFNGQHFVAGSKDGGKTPNYCDIGEFKIFYPRRLKR